MNLSVKDNNKLQLKILKEICADIYHAEDNLSAPYFSARSQAIIGKYCNTENIYRLTKENNLRKVKKYGLFVRTMIEKSDDRLETALRAAIAGNSFDLGANPDYDIEYEINRISSSEYHLPALKKFKIDLQKAKLILYIGDNYEEALFDKYLLEELSYITTVFAVRSRPVLNDITYEDAVKLKLHKICKVIESGSSIPGTDLREGTPEFLELFRNADIVIAKGQGNYETLADEKRPVYFLFKIKCNSVERRTGYPKGKGVFLYNQKRTNKTIKLIKSK
ncbi:MAG: ARMT1-like domain-containing protein [Ignavibacteria bacterium]|nr:ARMT1-like domain-containing protein [Ignavibacteria bacterium]